MKAVFLDFATVSGGDLDLARLQRLLPDLQLFDITRAEDIVERTRGATIVLINKLVMDEAAMAGNPALKLIYIMRQPVEKAKTPNELLRAYYGAIDRRDWKAAYRAWGQDGAASGQSYDEFKATLEETKATVMEIIGPERTEGAAGSIYATLPVVVRVDLKDGTRHNYAGQYVVKRVNDVPGATPEQLRWHIESADLRELR